MSLEAVSILHFEAASHFRLHDERIVAWKYTDGTNFGETTCVDMSEERNLYRDIVAVLFLLTAIFLAVSLVTYHPADPVPDSSITSVFYQHDPVVLPTSPTPANALGLTGATYSSFFLSFFGCAAYYIVITLIGISIWMFRDPYIGSPVIRTAGWFCSLIGVSTIISLVAPGVTQGPVIGGGGYLGMMGSTLLSSYVAIPGSIIFAACFTTAGLLAFSDYSLFNAIKWVVLSLAGGIIAAKVAAPSVKLGGLKDKLNRKKDRQIPEFEDDESDSYEDEYEEDEHHDDEFDETEEESDQALKIRIGGSEKVVRKEQPRLNIAKPDREDEDELDEEFTQDPEELYSEEMDADPIQQEIEFEGEDDTDDEYEVESDTHYEYEEDDEEDFAEVEDEPAELSVSVPNSPTQTSSAVQTTAQEEVRSKLDEAALVEHEIDYQLPSADLLQSGSGVSYDQQEKEVRDKAILLENALQQFGVEVKVVAIETGPVIAQYELELEPGLRLSKLTNLADDIAIALRVPSVRIVAPIPGKNSVGIEIPNENRQFVRLRDVMEEAPADKLSKQKIPLFLGKDVSGNPLVADLARLPHLLIAGRTGTGKSVCLNSIICSILMTRRPDEVKMLMIDPKMVELSGYGRLPHLMHPVVTDMRKAEAILAWAVDKMEERYQLLARAGVRHLTSYNQLGEDELMDRMKIEDEVEWANTPKNLPFIVIVADEMADLMMTAGKEVEQHIIRLAQKSRAVGIHLILATQKPTVDVITGLIKSNLPARIAFQVASKTDSRVVLDENGAEKLLGNGDMLFLGEGTSISMRGQGTFLSDEEIDSITETVSTNEQEFISELINLSTDDDEEEETVAYQKRDDLYEKAVDIIVREGRGSLSLLQRSLEIGYGRAARLIDHMSEDGIVGNYNGSKAREVLISVEQWEKMKGKNSGNETPPEPDDDPTPDPTPDPPPKRKPKTKREKLLSQSPSSVPSTNETVSMQSSLIEEVPASEEDVIIEDEYEDDEYEVEYEVEDESELNTDDDIETEEDIESSEEGGEEWDEDEVAASDDQEEFEDDSDDEIEYESSDDVAVTETNFENEYDDYEESDEEVSEDSEDEDEYEYEYEYVDDVDEIDGEYEVVAEDEWEEDDDPDDDPTGDDDEDDEYDHEENESEAHIAKFDNGENEDRSAVAHSIDPNTANDTNDLDELDDESEEDVEPMILKFELPEPEKNLEHESDDEFDLAEDLQQTFKPASGE